MVLQIRAFALRSVISTRKEAQAMVKVSRAYWIAALCALIAAGSAGVITHRASVPAQQSEPKEPPQVATPLGRNGDHAPLATQSKPQFSTAIRRLGPKAFSIEGSVIPPDGNASEVLSGLEPAARRGDSNAALLISLKLTECRSILERAGDYNALLADSQILGGIDAAEKAQTKRLSECEMLTSEDYQRHSEWLALSADAGNVVAQLMYARSSDSVIGPPSMMLKEPQRIVDYKIRAMDYLQQAARNGSVDALDSLGDAYFSGILTPQDPTRAYAYFLASYRVDSRSKPWAMEQLEASLSSRERNDATLITKDIYRECCESR